MTWLEQRGETFHVAFRFDGAKFKKSLKAQDRAEAEEIVARVERKLRLVEYGDLVIPEDVDVPTFMVTDGRVSKRPATAKSLTLASAFHQYKASLPQGALESTTMATIDIHLKHLVRILGARLSLTKLTLSTLQQYVTQRSKESGRRGRSLSPTTIKKELATLSAVWNWAVRHGLANSPFPNRGLRFPKTEQKPPFQTRAEIDRQIARGHLTDVEQQELWDCLFLTSQEVQKVLALIEKRAVRPCLFPMIAMAAHTGARRSEILRSRISDFDFDSNTVLIREKKRSKEKRTYRSVPMTSYLRNVMESWLSDPHGQLAFMHDSKPLSLADAWYLFRATFSGTDWEKIRGWHVFRHSFISNCAAKGIDQRMIDAWSGHQTEEMRRRYTHLFPDAQQTAIRSVFEGE